MCAVCGHPRSEHGQHQDFVMGIQDKRELCLECPGYEADDLPKGKAWHRFKAV